MKPNFTLSHLQRFSSLVALFGLIGVIPPFSITGQELRLSISKGPGSNTVLISYPSSTNGYYILNSSTNVPGNFRPAALALGTSGTRQFQSSNGPSPKAFFDLIREPLPLLLDQFSTLDQDGDGIDDYYELTHGLNPLNAADGPANLPAYLNSLPRFAWFDVDNSSLRVTDGAIALQIQLSKPYTGTLRYQVSGTAVSGKDFQPLTGTIPVSGTNAFLPITLIDTPQVESARSLVITLQEQTNTGPYSLSHPTAHRLDIIEGDRGVYSGTMGFTNEVFIGAQPLRVALRSGAGNTGVAYFDTTSSTLFTQPFAANVQFAGSNQFQFTAPVTGTINSTNLGRFLNWTLTFTGTEFSNQVINAGFDLSIQGLTSSGGPFLAKGTMILGAANK